MVTALTKSNTTVASTTTNNIVIPTSGQSTAKFEAKDFEDETDIDYGSVENNDSVFKVKLDRGVLIVPHVKVIFIILLHNCFTIT